MKCKWLYFCIIIDVQEMIIVKSEKVQAGWSGLSLRLKLQIELVDEFKAILDDLQQVLAEIFVRNRFDSDG